ncbi:MAG: DUF4203 domain-containing protein [Christensenellales bacterium]|jgi:hypothetical protein
MDMQVLPIILLILNLALGVVFCFFGNRWLKFVLGVYGFVVGFLIASTVLPMTTMMDETSTLLISLGVGLLGAALFILLMYVGIFCIGFGGGVLLSLLLAQVLKLSILEWYVYIPMLVIGSLLGALTLYNRRIFVSIFTAYIGASALAQFVDQMVNGINLQPGELYDPLAAYTSIVYLIALAGFFLTGLIVQLWITGKKKS